MVEEKDTIEEINIMHIDDMPKSAKDYINKVVKEKSANFQEKFKGFAKINIVSASPIRVGSIEPIEGTDVEWFKNNTSESEIDISNIF